MIKSKQKSISKHQDDSALSTKTQRISKQSVLAKSMMETPVPKTKESITAKGIKLCQKSDFKEQDYCTVCFRNYSTGFRRHHCRICTNACCDECSSGRVNLERACDLCYLKCSSQKDIQRRQKTSKILEKLCSYLMYSTAQKGEQLQKIKLASKQKSQQRDIKTKQDDQKQESSLRELKNQAIALSEKKKNLQNQLNLLVEKNKRLEEEMKNFEIDENE